MLKLSFNARGEQTPAEMIRLAAGRGLFLIIVAVLTLGVVIGAMEIADQSGWIAHQRVATVWASPGWQGGEVKACALLGDIQTPGLACNRGAQPQRMNVEFRGSLHAVEWNCRRSGEWITCRAK